MARRTAGGVVQDRPWWKEWLGIGTKREWLFVALVALVGFLYVLDREGLGKAAWVMATTSAGMLIAGWLKKGQKSEDERQAVLGVRDSRRDSRTTPS